MLLAAKAPIKIGLKS